MTRGATRGSATTVYDLLSLLHRGDGARPFVTYEGPEGRTELSVRTFDNNVAKLANFLVDGLDVEPGDAVALALPAHWQTPVWLAACWSVRAIVTTSVPDARVVAFAASDEPPTTTGELVAVSTHPFGLPVPVPAGVVDAATEVRSHGDHFAPMSDPLAGDLALALNQLACSQQQLLAAGRAAVGSRAIGAGARLATRRDPVDVTAVLGLLVIPLLVDGSVVVGAARDAVDVRWDDDESGTPTA